MTFPPFTVQVESYGDHTLILTADRKVYGCGLNDANTRLLGVSTAGTYSLPEESDLITQSPKFIYTTEEHSAFIGCNRQVYAWGANNNGQILGATASSFENTPRLLGLESPLSWVVPSGSLQFGPRSGHGVFFSSTILPVGVFSENLGQASVEFGTGAALNPQFGVRQGNVRFQSSFIFEEVKHLNVVYQYAHSSKVTPGGTVVQTAVFPPSSPWVVLPYYSNASSAFSLSSVLSNCATVAVGTEFFEPNTSGQFAGNQFSFLRRAAKFSFILWGWSYVNLANSVRWTIRLTSSGSVIPVVLNNVVSGNFSVITATASDNASFRSLIVRTITVAVVSDTFDVFFKEPVIKPYTIEAFTTSNVLDVRYTFPAGARNIFVDPDISGETGGAASPLSSTDSSLPLGAIIGIAVGAVVLGVLAAILIVFISRKRTARATAEMSQNLKNQSLTQMRDM